MARVKKYEAVVYYILKTYKATRSDDKLLYYWFLREEGFSTKLTIESYLLGNNNYPNYDSITRCRRKLQETYPFLRPPKNEQERRDEAEKDFRAYARGEE